MPLHTDDLRDLGRRVLLIAIGVNAALGVSALLGDFGTTQGNLLLTSLLITGASAVGLACAAAQAAGRLAWVPWAGILLSLFGFGTFVVVVWSDFLNNTPMQVGLSGIIPASAIAHASLLSLADLAPRHEPVRRTAYLLITIVAIILVAAVWGSPSDEWGRILAIALVLLAAATAAVPILARSQVAEQPDDHARNCPFCGGGLDIVVGRPTTCPRCARSFRIQT